eukprot:TRINITY_DN37182_c0_g1_i1.p1 TRINITY_DN37182_c0_g1~~TRINITY_DN37182_c0_g1_i1.p1  ORF type:complete len:372 (-),score=95.01 TRINITY_DN37182_c0_g1_i1:470-1519(-)
MAAAAVGKGLAIVAGVGGTGCVLAYAGSKALSFAANDAELQKWLREQELRDRQRRQLMTAVGKGLAIVAGVGGTGCVLAYAGSKALSFAANDAELQKWLREQELRDRQRRQLMTGGSSSGSSAPARPTLDQVQCCKPTESERHLAFDQKAANWDSLMHFDELTMGLGWWRSSMVQHARGHVLEFAIGTGRNFRYYDASKVQSITGVDWSSGMLAVADTKREELQDIPLELRLNKSKQLEFEDCTFDTVVDTFGICSFECPVATLQELRRVVKPDGQVLLLEHGASSWDFVQGLLDRTADGHAEKWGCYPNRDIIGLVNKAGLHIESTERTHFGTTYKLICKRDKPAATE